MLLCLVLFLRCSAYLLGLFSKTLLKGKGPRLVKEISLKLTTYAGDQMGILFIGNLGSPLHFGVVEIEPSILLPVFLTLNIFVFKPCCCIDYLL